MYALGGQPGGVAEAKAGEGYNPFFKLSLIPGGCVSVIVIEIFVLRNVRNANFRSQAIRCTYIATYDLHVKSI